MQITRKDGRSKQAEEARTKTAEGKQAERLGLGEERKKAYEERRKKIYLEERRSAKRNKELKERSGLKAALKRLTMERYQKRKINNIDN